MRRALLLSAAAHAALVFAACYPKTCDPARDPLRCECPPGPCGPYPGETSTRVDAAARDSGADAR
jgi:hypothetical protein